MAATNLVIPQKDTAEGYESEIDTNDDGLAAAGFYPQEGVTNDLLVGIERDSSGNLVLKDVVVGSVVLQSLSGGSGISETQHEQLDTLAHSIVENCYESVSYSGNKVTNSTTWSSISMTTKIREEQIAYSGNRVAQIISIQYDGAGVEKYRITETFSYAGNAISSITRVRT